MKSIIHTLFISITLFSCSSVYAYRWIMNNFTKKPLLVQIELKASTNPYFVLIQPDESGDFDWSTGNVMGGFCLGAIKYVIPSPALLNNSGGFTKVTANGATVYEVTDSKRIVDILEHYEEVYRDTKKIDSRFPPRTTVELRFLSDKYFNETVEQAKLLTGTEVGAKIVGWVADLIKQSECRSRDIYIVEEEGKINFYTLAN